MTQKEFLKEIRQYKTILEEILSRFHHTRESISIDSKDDAIYHQKIVEINDFLHDFLGTNQYASMITVQYQEGLANFFRSPSYDSVKKIITVLGAVITRYERQDFSPQRSETNKQSDIPSFQNITTTFRKHWIVTLTVYSIFLVSSTWYVANELLIKPRDFQIDSLRRTNVNRTSSANKSIVLEPTGVHQGTSVTSIDGGCLIAIQQIVGDSARIRVILDNAPPKFYPWMRSGDRITAVGKKGYYYIDLQRFRGNMVDIAVSLVPGNE